MKYFLKIRRHDQSLLLTAYEKTGEPVCEGRVSQHDAPFLIRALQHEDAFDSQAGPNVTPAGTGSSGVCYRNQNLYLAGVSLDLEGQEREKIADDLARLIPQRASLLA